MLRHSFVCVAWELHSCFSPVHFVHINASHTAKHKRCSHRSTFMFLPPTKITHLPPKPPRLDTRTLFNKYYNIFVFGNVWSRNDYPTLRVPGNVMEPPKICGTKKSFPVSLPWSLVLIYNILVQFITKDSTPAPAMYN